MWKEYLMKIWMFSNMKVEVGDSAEEADAEQEIVLNAFQ